MEIYLQAILREKAKLFNSNKYDDESIYTLKEFPIQNSVCKLMLQILLPFFYYSNLNRKCSITKDCVMQMFSYKVCEKFLLVLTE